MSYAARSVRERRPLIIHDVKNDMIPNSEGDFPDSPDISSIIIAPLIFLDQVLGAIALGSFRRYIFTESNQNLLVSFAAMATTAIQNAQLHEEVKRQAKTDTLTGLFNRRGFFELALREVSRSHRFRRPLAAVMFDIDNFKEINDRYGHTVGDQILSGVSSKCQAELRQIDLISRYGGDEFLLLLPETDLPNAIPVAERLRNRATEMAFPAEDTLVKITLSAGIAYLQDNDTLDTLIERTDQALYKAKQAGKNCISF
jgi:diguanylate cyclase (GGDEF)-like protein